MLSRHTPHNLPQNPLSVIKDPYAFVEELARALERQRLRGDNFELLIGHERDSDGRKDVLEAADHVSLDGLGGDVCDEGFDLDL